MVGFVALLASCGPDTSTATDALGQRTAECLRVCKSKREEGGIKAVIECVHSCEQTDAGVP